MNDSLLQHNNQQTYDTLDNICSICLEPLYSNYIELSIYNSDADSHDSTELVDVDLDSKHSSRENSMTDLWTCNNCKNIFHLNCISEWKGNKTNFKCSICRQSHILEIIQINIDSPPSYKLIINFIIFILLLIIISLLVIFIILFIPWFQRKFLI